MAEPFLRFLARTFVTKADLADYCFVFPNRRSGKFFEKELADAASTSILMPEITTITNFISDITGGIEANRIESLFTLYNAYCEIAPDNNTSFDKFAHWGDVILNDFGDVERYMVDAKELFVNISELKAIKANYLNDEVIEVLSHFFNIRKENNSNENFWQHISAVDGEVSIQRKFISIWDTLYPLYEKYCQKLQESGLTTGALSLRAAEQKVREMDITDFNSKHYVFAGFNVLSTAEHKLFEAMRNKGFSDFYWDYNSPAFASKQNRATKFISQYIKEFPSIYQEEKNPTMPPNVNIIGVPSNYGQTKYVGKLINQLVDNHIIADANNAIDTAIVMPDEQLFTSMLKSIDTSKVPNVNVTMGVSIRNSSIATLMAAVSRLHYQASYSNDEWTYFHADVKDILMHPLARFAFGNNARELIEYITNENLYQIPYSTICKYLGSDNKLFDIDQKLNIVTVENYITRVIEFARHILTLQESTFGRKALKEVVDDPDEAPGTSVEIAFLNKYCDAMAELDEVFKQYVKRNFADFNLDVNTFCFLLERLVNQAKIAFEGEPLGGLQVMGVLETRCLDFKNVIILSMNERIFPRKHFTKSFIPQQLRKGYKMSTISHQESMYAYYFYRMISRAENVYLVYNTASISEESRFIHQLRVLFADQCHINRHLLNLGLRLPGKGDIAVPKDERIMNILSLYKAEPEANADRNELIKSKRLRQLSAHSINEYINCPLRFYLHYVEGLAEIEEKSDFMEASTFGTIIHNIMQTLYPQKEMQITTDYINNLLDEGNQTIRRTIVQVINKEFLHKGEGCNDPLIGEGLMKSEIIDIMIRNILKYDLEYIKNNGPINYIQSEREIACRLTLGNHTFNFTYIIDRLEATNDGTTLRIIDYKTGKDKTSFQTLDALFAPGNSVSYERCKAALQLLLYCYAYEQCDSRPMQPVIYKVIRMKDSGLYYNKAQITYPKYQKIKSKETIDIDIRSEFVERIGEVIDGIFDADKPFTQTKNKEANCKYCKFKDFCRIN